MSQAEMQHLTLIIECLGYERLDIAGYLKKVPTRLNPGTVTAAERENLRNNIAAGLRVDLACKGVSEPEKLIKVYFDDENEETADAD